MADELKDLKELLKRLSAAVGVTGHEAGVRDLVAQTLEPYVDDVERDVVGSLTTVKRGNLAAAKAPRRKVMLAAHLDEIGAIVLKIEDQFLRFTALGGLDRRLLMGQEVVVHGRRDLPGVVASQPPHLTGPEDRSLVPPVEELFIDVGLASEALADQVRVGDLISFARAPDELLADAVSGKALDNRASVAAMVVCMQHLSRLQHAWDVYAVGTAQEEWGNFGGATTRAYAIEPDVALVIDVTFADTPGLYDVYELKMNGGPALGTGPNMHPVLLRRLQETAAALEMKTQLEPLPGHSGTDAWSIQVSRVGIPTALISIPLRYMHSPVEVVQPRDVERAGRLMAHFVAGLDEALVDQLVPKDGLTDVEEQ